MKRSTAAREHTDVEHVAEVPEYPSPRRLGLGFVRDCDWVADAACVPDEGDMFYAEGRESVRSAVQVCIHCAVKQECLAFALANDERYGVWGGTTPEQRRAITSGHDAESSDGSAGGLTPPAA